MRSESMFKETALGLRPSNWDEVFLGDVFAEVNTRVKDLSDVEPPVLSMTSRDGLVLQSDRFKNRVASSDISNYKVVSRGQLVYGFPIDEGVIAMLHRYPVGVVSPAYNVWKPKINFDMMFMDAMLRTPSMVEVYKRFASTSVHRRRNLSKRDFKRVPVVLPPLPEQHAIADALCTVQQAKEATEQVIEATRELKKSLMRYLFTYGPVPMEEAERVPLKETEIGLVPEEWKVVKLGEIGEVTAGGSAPQERYYFNGRHPFVRVQHLDEDGYWVRRWDLITDEAVQAYRLRFFPKGTIVLPKSGASIRLEKRAVLPVDAYIVSHLCAVIPNSKAVDQRYLFYALKVRKFSSEKVEGYPTLNLSEIRNALMPLPPLSEQRAIARVLRTVDKKLQAEEARKQALEALFKSLLNNLMTGKIRVKDVVLPNVGEGKGDVTH